jgi:hypothetical protein
MNERIKKGIKRQREKWKKWRYSWMEEEVSERNDQTVEWKMKKFMKGWRN